MDMITRCFRSKLRLREIMIIIFVSTGVMDDSDVSRNVLTARGVQYVNFCPDRILMKRNKNLRNKK